jgi:hypothetical protein
MFQQQLQFQIMFLVGMKLIGANIFPKLSFLNVFGDFLYFVRGLQSFMSPFWHKKYPLQIQCQVWMLVKEANIYPKQSVIGAYRDFCGQSIDEMSMGQQKKLTAISNSSLNATEWDKHLLKAVCLKYLRWILISL